LKQRVIVINLAVMMMAWLAASFCYYLIGFELKYLPGDIFTNTYASAISDCVATVVAAPIFNKCGIKWSLVMSFGSSAVGSFIICVYGWTAGGTWTLPILVIVTKFGISAAFNVVYLGNGVLFPTLFAATSMGICNIFARIATIGAPFVAEIDGVTPIWIAFATSSIATGMSFFLKKPEAE